MAKFIMTVGDETLRVLTTEAENRNLRIQQLLRAVIVPEWVTNNLEMRSIQPSRREIDPRLTHPSVYNTQREPVLEASMDRIRRRRANALRSTTF
jgi:hypothetical protein